PAREAARGGSDGDAAGLAGLVGDVREPARLDGGARNIRRAAVAPADLVGRALEQRRGLARARPLRVDVAPDLRPVLVEAGPGEGGLPNLLANAAKHSPPGRPGPGAAPLADREPALGVAGRRRGPPPPAARGRSCAGWAGRAPGRRGRAGGGGGGAFCGGRGAAGGGRTGAENPPGGGARPAARLPLARDCALGHRLAPWSSNARDIALA